MHVISADMVRQFLPMRACIDVVREAMRQVSASATKQPLRQVVNLPNGRLLGVMPGLLPDSGFFGAKIVSVDHNNRGTGRPSHQGGVMLFEPQDGSPVALVHAGEITAIRTAAASAVATDELALSDAACLAILGTGEQALAHARSIPWVRPITEVRIWGRNQHRVDALVKTLREEGLPAHGFSDVGSCSKGAHVICTTTASRDPVLFSRDVDDGIHINLVGSSVLGPREVDDALVVRSKFFGDSLPGVLAQGAEFQHARQQGLVDERHLLGEIGEVIARSLEGRTNARDVTIYKSLGHVAQDLASARFVYEAVRAQSTLQVSF